MANVTIKDIPERIYQELKDAAKAEGRSLNGYIISVLTDTADERNRRKSMRENRDEFRHFLASLPRLEDSTPLIRQDRDTGH